MCANLFNVSINNPNYIMWIIYDVSDSLFGEGEPFSFVDSSLNSQPGSGRRLLSAYSDQTAILNKGSGTRLLSAEACCTQVSTYLSTSDVLGAACRV